VIRSEFRTAVRTRMGNPSTDGFFSDVNLNDLIDEAVLTVGTEADWPWLMSTGSNISAADGTATYAIGDTSYTRTRGLCINGFDPLEERSLVDLRGMPTTTEGRPLYYAVVGLTVHLRPVPDASYTLLHDIVTAEVALASDGASPLLPVMYHHAVVAKACELAHLRQSDAQRAALHLSEYAAWIERMRDNVSRTPAAPVPFWSQTK
jgi:hypothetical protein